MTELATDINNLPIDKFYRFAKEICEGQTSQDYFYSTKENKFYHYGNGVWNEIENEELLKQLGTHIFEIKTKDGITKVTLNKYNTHYRNEVLRNIQQINNMGLEKINQYPFINLQNGMFDPIGINFIKHDKKYYSTNQLPYIYGLNAKCDLWIKSLNEIFECDKIKINILQEFFGYCLTRDTKHHKALLLLGESRSGKSTIIQTLRHMIGTPNCSTVPLKYISNAQYTAMLINKLVNIDTDVSSKAEMYEAEFKTITSGEPVAVNQKYIATFDFVPYCKIVLAANIFPRITDHSSAFYNRLVLIPCDRVFSYEEQNRDLPSLLLNELSGIFNWSIEGLKRLIKRGKFEDLDFMKDAIQTLENENNPANIFFDEHIEIEFNSYIEKTELFRRYKDWCEKNKQNTVSHILFSRNVLKRFGKETPKLSRLSSAGRPWVWKNLKYVEFKIEKEEIEIPLDKTASPSTIAAQGDINWEE